MADLFRPALITADHRPTQVKDALDALESAASVDELASALRVLTQDDGGALDRAADFVGGEHGPFVGFNVLFVNEWNIPQPRVLLVSGEATFRVAFKADGTADHYTRIPHESLTMLVKCSSPTDFFNLKSSSGLQVYVTLPVDDLAWGLRMPARWRGQEEIDVKQEYVPLSLTLPAKDGVDVMVAVLLRAGELLRESSGRSWPMVAVSAWERRGINDPAGRWMWQYREELARVRAAQKAQLAGGAFVGDPRNNIRVNL
eukprot:CAMPEP_0181217744 /NCGR_PEP_ID=MMETSP1096-20121128/27314_1 /TAXON_ID=156174 ORGANISM="Chrysochromulina ericina, Strain CCMP281" /NCGR_SAMPLE_ID=MMETSP1096 /ASSEMBLY_ACC=CAM_ASM_000453 /LENGTH=257 /DNA_ID=CAMNT_0023309895 /DNA_START=67 /DNA_END=841 /DNA_ORIENTATION=+